MKLVTFNPIVQVVYITHIVYTVRVHMHIYLKQFDTALTFEYKYLPDRVRCSSTSPDGTETIVHCYMTSVVLHEPINQIQDCTLQLVSRYNQRTDVVIL
jgi:hypothetical protein